MPVNYNMNFCIATLERIAGTVCENYTTGLGSCYEQDPCRFDTATEEAFRTCNACQADATLKKIGARK